MRRDGLDDHPALLVMGVRPRTRRPRIAVGAGLGAHLAVLLLLGQLLGEGVAVFRLRHGVQVAAGVAAPGAAVNRLQLATGRHAC